MKPLHGDTVSNDSCSSTSCGFKNDSKHLTYRRLLTQGSRIDKLCHEKHVLIPLRESKLLEKLVKTRALYEDLRNQLLSSNISSRSEANIESTEQPSCEPEKNLEEAEKSDIVALVNLIDKGVILKSKKLNECCPYPECCSTSQANYGLKEGRQRQIHVGGFLTSKSSMISKPKVSEESRLGIYPKTKNIKSDPCTCISKMHEMIQRKSKELSKKARAVPVKSNRVRKKSYHELKRSSPHSMKVVELAKINTRREQMIDTQSIERSIPLEKDIHVHEIKTKMTKRHRNSFIERFETETSISTMKNSSVIKHREKLDIENVLPTTVCKELIEEKHIYRKDICSKQTTKKQTKRPEKVNLAVPFVNIEFENQAQCFANISAPLPKKSSYLPVYKRLPSAYNINSDNLHYSRHPQIKKQHDTKIKENKYIQTTMKPDDDNYALKACVCSFKLNTIDVNINKQINAISATTNRSFLRKPILSAESYILNPSSIHLGKQSKPSHSIASNKQASFLKISIQSQSSVVQVDLNDTGNHDSNSSISLTVNKTACKHYPTICSSKNVKNIQFKRHSKSTKSTLSKHVLKRQLCPLKFEKIIARSIEGGKKSPMSFYCNTSRERAYYYDVMCQNLPHKYYFKNVSTTFENKCNVHRLVKSVGEFKTQSIPTLKIRNALSSFINLKTKPLKNYTQINEKVAKQRTLVLPNQDSNDNNYIVKDKVCHRPVKRCFYSSLLQRDKNKVRNNSALRYRRTNKRNNKHNNNYEPMRTVIIKLFKKPYRLQSHKLKHIVSQLCKCEPYESYENTIFEISERNANLKKSDTIRDDPVNLTTLKTEISGCNLNISDDDTLLNLKSKEKTAKLITTNMLTQINLCKLRKTQNLPNRNNSVQYCRFTGNSEKLEQIINKYGASIPRQVLTHMNTESPLTNRSEDLFVNKINSLNLNKENKSKKWMTHLYSDNKSLSSFMSASGFPLKCKNIGLCLHKRYSKLFQGSLTNHQILCNKMPQNHSCQLNISRSNLPEHSKTLALVLKPSRKEHLEEIYAPLIQKRMVSRPQLTGLSTLLRRCFCTMNVQIRTPEKIINTNHINNKQCKTKVSVPEKSNHNKHKKFIVNRIMQNFIKKTGRHNSTNYNLSVKSSFKYEPKVRFNKNVISQPIKRSMQVKSNGFTYITLPRCQSRKEAMRHNYSLKVEFYKGRFWKRNSTCSHCYKADSVKKNTRHDTCTSAYICNRRICPLKLHKRGRLKNKIGSQIISRPRLSLDKPIFRTSIGSQTPMYKNIFSRIIPPDEYEIADFNSYECPELTSNRNIQSYEYLNFINKNKSPQSCSKNFVIDYESADSVTTYDKMSRSYTEPTDFTDSNFSYNVETNKNDTDISTSNLSKDAITTYKPIQNIRMLKHDRTSNCKSKSNKRLQLWKRSIMSNFFLKRYFCSANNKYPSQNKVSGDYGTVTCTYRTEEVILPMTFNKLIRENNQPRQTYPLNTGDFDLRVPKSRDSHTFHVFNTISVNNSISNRRKNDIGYLHSTSLPLSSYTSCKSSKANLERSLFPQLQSNKMKLICCKTNSVVKIHSNPNYECEENSRYKSNDIYRLEVPSFYYSSSTFRKCVRSLKLDEPNQPKDRTANLFRNPISGVYDKSVVTVYKVQAKSKKKLPNKCDRDLCLYNVQFAGNNKQVVRLNSNFNFGIEFNKNSSPSKPPGITYVKSPVRTSQATQGSHAKNHKTQHGSGPHDSASQVNAKTKKKKEKKQQTLSRETENSSSIGTKAMQPDKPLYYQNRGTQKQDRHSYQLESYECEPGVCIPGKCDPYECLERIKSRNTHSKGTKTRPAQQSTNTQAQKSKLEQKQKTSKDTEIAKPPQQEKPAATYGGPKQAVRFGSSFSFNIEFYRETTEIDEPNRYAKIPYRSSGTSSNKRVRSISSVYGGPESYDRGTGSRPYTESKGTSSKRCYCTLKLQKVGKSQTKKTPIENITYKNQCVCTPRQYEPPHAREVGTATKRLTDLEPYECEPGVCVPGECDPHECLKLINLRNKSNSGTGTRAHRKRTANTQIHKDRGDVQRKAALVKPPPSRLPSHPPPRRTPALENIHVNRQSVRLGSTFNFDIEFCRGGREGRSSASGKDHSTDMKKHATNKTAGTYGSGYNKRVQAKSSNESKGSGGSALKRCFCTLTLQRAEIKTRMNALTNRHCACKLTEEKSTRTKNKYLTEPPDVKPEPCERGICEPGKCNPQECLERIKKKSRKRVSRTKKLPENKNVDKIVEEPRINMSNIKQTSYGMRSNINITVDFFKEICFPSSEESVVMYKEKTIQKDFIKEFKKTNKSIQKSAPKHTSPSKTSKPKEDLIAQCVKCCETIPIVVAEKSVAADNFLNCLCSLKSLKPGQKPDKGKVKDDVFGPCDAKCGRDAAQKKNATCTAVCADEVQKKGKKMVCPRIHERCRKLKAVTIGQVLINPYIPMHKSSIEGMLYRVPSSKLLNVQTEQRTVKTNGVVGAEETYSKLSTADMLIKCIYSSKHLLPKPETCYRNSVIAANRKDNNKNLSVSNMLMKNIYFYNSKNNEISSALILPSNLSSTKLKSTRSERYSSNFLRAISIKSFHTFKHNGIVNPVGHLTDLKRLDDSSLIIGLNRFRLTKQKQLKTKPHISEDTSVEIGKRRSKLSISEMLLKDSFSSNILLDEKSENSSSSTILVPPVTPITQTRLKPRDFSTCVNKGVNTNKRCQLKIFNGASLNTIRRFSIFSPKKYWVLYQIQYPKWSQYLNNTYHIEQNKNNAKIMDTKMSYMPLKHNKSISPSYSPPDSRKSCYLVCRSNRNVYRILGRRHSYSNKNTNLFDKYKCYNFNQRIMDKIHSSEGKIERLPLSCSNIEKEMSWYVLLAAHKNKKIQTDLFKPKINYRPININFKSNQEYKVSDLSDNFWKISNKTETLPVLYHVYRTSAPVVNKLLQTVILPSSKITKSTSDLYTVDNPSMFRLSSRSVNTLDIIIYKFINIFNLITIGDNFKTQHQDSKYVNDSKNSTTFSQFCEFNSSRPFFNRLELYNTYPGIVSKTQSCCGNQLITFKDNRLFDLKIDPSENTKIKNDCKPEKVIENNIFTRNLMSSRHIKNVCANDACEYNAAIPKEKLKNRHLKTYPKCNKLDVLPSNLMKYKNVSNYKLVAKLLLDISSLGVRPLNDMLSVGCTTVTRPKRTYGQMKKIVFQPKAAFHDIKELIKNSSTNATLKRIHRRWQAFKFSQSMKRKKFEQNSVIYYLVSKKLYPKLWPRVPMDFSCNFLYILNLSNVICFWAFYICPYMKPFGITLLRTCKQFRDILIFMFAIVLWSPCLVARQLCRSILCCLFCSA